MSYQILGVDDPALLVLDQQLKTHPEWDTHLKIIPWAEYQTQMMEALKSEVSPYQAVCAPGHIWLPGLVAEGLLESFEDIHAFIEPEIMAAYEASDIIPSVANECQFNQKQYMLPLFTDGHIIFYRKDLINLSSTQDVPVVDPLKLHLLLEGLNLKQGMYPLALKAHASEILLDWLPYLWAAGGDVMDKDGNIRFNSPAAITALDYYISLKKYCSPETDRYGNQEISNAIKQGQVALAVSWGGQAASILDETNPYRDLIGTAVFTKPWNATWGVSLPVNQTQSDKIGILSVLYEAASSEQDRQVTRVAGSPVRKSSYRAEELLQFSWLAAQQAMLQRCSTLPSDVRFSQYLGGLYNAVYEAFTETKTSVEALNKAASYI